LPRARQRGYAVPMRQQRQRGTRIPVSEYIRDGWTQDRCTACNGTGLAYVRTRPEGPISAQERCRECRGRGSTWLSPAGRRAAFPGGPFLTR
jgi:DnaJ-class molecular chaperone